MKIDMKKYSELVDKSISRKKAEDAIFKVSIDSDNYETSSDEKSIKKAKAHHNNKTHHHHHAPG